jgi:hypothetical protein
MKHKSRINFLIDVVMFLMMMAIAGIGFLMKYVLVPGSERWEKYGSNVDLFLWGWDRHQWGALHLILGYILLGLLILHIFFHWKQIIAMFKNLICKKSIRIVLICLFLIVSFFMFLFAFIINVDVVTPKPGEGEHREERSRPASEKINHENSVSHHESSIEVVGSMTLKEVENRYHIPADSLKKLLAIPMNLSVHEKLGRLRRAYGFHMSDVERLIEKFLSDKN